MKRLLLLGLAAAGWVLPGTLFAQDYEYHPLLSDRFTATLGAMRSSDVFKISAEDLTDRSSDDVDFGDDLGVSRHSTFFNGQLRWKFGNEERWSIWGQYFSNNAKGSKTLTEDVDWDGVIFREGTNAEAGIKLSVARLFLGYSLFKNERNDFGIGAGIHNLDLSAYIKGEVIVDEESSGEQRAEVSSSQVLPNVGAWYYFSPARRWVLHARIDWIGADIGDYDGDMWNAVAGVNFQAFRHIGFDLFWQYFNLNVNVDKSDWRGGVDLRYSGPVIAVTAAW
jgi:hypothetical protein